MTYSNADMTEMKEEATKIIGYIGRACGLTYKEITEAKARIQQKTPALVAHCRDREMGRDPFRIVLLALVDLRKDEEKVWYKPWRTWRFQKIIQRYSNWWEQFDSSVGVARAIDPVAARLQTT